MKVSDMVGFIAGLLTAAVIAGFWGCGRWYWKRRNHGDGSVREGRLRLIEEQLASLQARVPGQESIGSSSPVVAVQADPEGTDPWL